MPGNGMPQRAGVAQLVERQPSKLAVAGSTPVARSSNGDRSTGPREKPVRESGGTSVVVDVAQLVELRIVDPAAAGSSPVIHPRFSKCHHENVILSEAKDLDFTRARSSIG